MPIAQDGDRRQKALAAALLALLALLLALVAALAPAAAAEAADSGAVLNDLRDIYFSAPTIDTGTLAGATAVTLIAYWNDETVYRSLRTLDTPALTRAGGYLETYAGPLTWLGIAGAVALKDPATGYLAANAIIYAGVTTELLKTAFGVTRPRAQAGHEPHPFRYFGDGKNDSMPSGHTSTAFALARVLATRYPKQQALFYAGAAVVALSRIYAGAHWPSDVIAAAAVGVWSADQVLGRSRLFHWEW